MEAKHSAEPWILCDDGRTILAGRVADGETGQIEKFICEVGDTVEGLEGDDPEADANARLIAASPVLLAACRNQAAWIERLLQSLEYRTTYDSRGTLTTASPSRRRPIGR